MLRYVGRKSGKTYQIPLRFVTLRDQIYCVTRTTQWWTSTIQAPQVTLWLRGRPVAARARRMNDDDPITREAYSHEVSSVGWWPGDETAPYAAFYAYASPEPAAFPQTTVHPAAAFYDREASQFRLKYDDVRSAPSPRQAVLDFCQSTYEAAAIHGQWNRAELER